MDTFIALPATTAALILAALAGVIAFNLLILGTSNILMVKWALRNMLRRPSQMLLILGGLALSIALITASIGFTDSTANSIKTARVVETGNVDETLTNSSGNFDPALLTQWSTTLKNSSNVDAVSALTAYFRGNTVYDTRTKAAIAQTDLFAVQPDFDHVWGPLTNKNGQTFHVSDLQPNDIFLSATMATTLKAQTGDTVQMFFKGTSHTYTVRAILSTDIAADPNELTYVNIQSIVMRLDEYQRITHIPHAINTLYVKNAGSGGMNDIGPNGIRSASVTNFMQQLVNTASQTGHYIVKTIKPDAITANAGSIYTFLLGSNNDAPRQFNEVLPAITCLLIGTGMLLIILLFILLAAERKAEMGMSRAIGLQRFHLIEIVVFEGWAYTLIATLIGVPIGLGIVALEMAFLSTTPLGNDGHLVLSLQVGWPGLLISCCLGLTLAFFVIVFVSYRISRTNIVAAIRDLEDTPDQQHQGLRSLTLAVGTLLKRKTAPLTRRTNLFTFIWMIYTSGLLMLLLGFYITQQGVEQAETWIYLCGIASLLLGVSQLLSWILKSSTRTRKLADRIGTSVLGSSWLLYSILPSGFLERWLQLPDPSGYDTSAESNLLKGLLPVTGAVILIIANGEWLSLFLRWITSRVHGLAPVSHISLSYPLTFKSRTGVTVIMFGLVTFMLVYIILIGAGGVQSKQEDLITGRFEIQTHSPGLPSDLAQQIQADPKLKQDIAVTASAHVFPFSNPFVGVQAHFGQSTVSIRGVRVAAANDALLSNTRLPIQPRAQGFTSDRQVWDAVKNHPGYAVIAFNSLKDIGPIKATAPSFAPFTATVTDTSGHTLRVTVIGFIPSQTNWQFMYTSVQTTASAYGSQAAIPNWYFFRVRQGLDPDTVAYDLSATFTPKYAIEVEPLVGKIAQSQAVGTNITLFFSSYLSLGLIFGVAGLGVVMSRAVVERRQQIGMLRAIGFSRSLVLCSFLMESSFIALLGIILGTLLAAWTAYEFLLQSYPSQHNFPIPPVLIALLGGILLMMYLATLVATALPARAAAKTLPAEALRYE